MSLSKTFPKIGSTTGCSIPARIRNGRNTSLQNAQQNRSPAASFCNRNKGKDTSKSLPDDKLKTIQQTLDVMEQKYSESEMKITRLLSEKKELEEQLEMKDKFVCMAVRHLQELEKERNYLKMWVLACQECIKGREEEAEVVITYLKHHLWNVMQKLKTEKIFRVRAENELKHTAGRLAEMKEINRQLLPEKFDKSSNTIAEEESKHNEMKTTQVLRNSTEDLINKAEEEKMKLLEIINKAGKEYEVNLQETTTKYDAIITEKDKKIQQLLQSVMKQQVVICQKQLDIEERNIIIYNQREDMKDARKNIDLLKRQIQGKNEISKPQLCKKKYEATSEETSAKYDAMLTEKDKEIQHLNECIKYLMESLSSIQEEKALLTTQLKEKKEINTEDDICNENIQMQGKISQLQQQIRDLQAALREINDKNVEFQVMLSQEQLDIEDGDHARCKQRQALKAHMQIGFMHQDLQEKDERNSKLQVHLDKQHTHRKMVLDLEASLASAVREKEHALIALCNKGLDIERRDCIIRELQIKLATCKEKNCLLRKRK